MELVDLYDDNRIKTSQTVERWSKFPKNHYHVVIHVCIFNDKSELLIQQRQSFKKGWPNLWDLSVGGAVMSGETSQQAAEREVREELGISLNFQKQRPAFSLSFDNGFDDMYVVKKSLELSELTLQYEEVQNVKWATKQEVTSMLQERIFIPYYPSLIDFIFDVKDSQNAYTEMLF